MEELRPSHFLYGLIISPFTNYCWQTRWKKRPKIFGMKTTCSHNFGALLKALRTERQLSQQKLAEFAGVERNYIYYLEKGKSEPTLGVLIGLANGLGLSLSELAHKIEEGIQPNTF